MTGPQLHKVVYRPDTQSTDEYMVIVNPEEYHKWKEGDTSIPLALVLDSFEVFFSTQGNQGVLGRASKQQLENLFGTSREDDVAKAMLERGTIHSGSGPQWGGLDKSRHGAHIDTRGSGGGLHGV